MCRLWYAVCGIGYVGVSQEVVLSGSGAPLGGISAKNLLKNYSLLPRTPRLSCMHFPWRRTWPQPTTPPLRQQLPLFPGKGPSLLSKIIRLCILRIEQSCSLLRADLPSSATSRQRLAAYMSGYLQRLFRRECGDMSCSQTGSDVIEGKDRV